MKNSTIVCGLILVLLLLTGCGGGGGEDKLAIDLVGEQSVLLGYDTLWEDPGVNISGEGAGTADLNIQGTVDTTQPGSYRVTYTASTQDGRVASATRTVVVDNRQFVLTVSAFGKGAIQINGSGQAENCTDGVCRFSIREGTTLTLSAASDAEYEFSGWEFCNSVDSGQCKVTLDKDRLISAIFTSITPPSINSSVVELTESQIRSIKDYSPDSGIIQFEAGTDLTGIGAGTIIVSKGIYFVEGDPSNIEIYFALRIREIIELTGSTIIIKTVPVSLEDVIDSGTLIFKDSQSQVLKGYQSKSISRSYSKGASYSIPINVEINPNFSVIGSMAISVDPDYAFDFDTQSGIRSARALVRVTHTGQLGIEIKDEISTNIPNIPIGTYRLKPIIVGLVVIVPVIDVTLQGKALAEVAIQPNVSLNTTVIAGAHYHENSGWTNIGQFTPSISGDVGEVNGRAAVEGVLAIDVTAEVYDVAGPKLGVNPGGGFEAVAVVAPQDDCVYEYGFYGKVEANIGGKFSVFSRKLKYEAKLIDYQRPFGGRQCAVDTEAPSTPLNVVAQVQSDEAIDVKWDAATDNVRVAHYEVWRRSGAFQTATRIQPEWAGTQFSDTGLEPQEEYCYFIIAVDGRGNVSEAPSQLACATTEIEEDITPPTTPGSFAVEPISTTSIGLSWSQSTDDVGVLGYVIYEHLPTGQTLALNYADADSLIYNIFGLASAQEYCFSISAVDKTGNQSLPTPTTCASTLDSQLAAWTMFLACQGREYRIEEKIDLNETLTSTVEVADVGQDYPGTNLSYILRGAYDVDSNNLSARITWSFENQSGTRIDEFAADLSSGDSGDVSMNQIQSLGGCDAIVRFVKDGNTKAKVASTRSVNKRNENANLTFSGK